MSDFFAKDEKYEEESTSNYMKFEKGENRFRILGTFAEKTAIQGWEYWTTEGGKRKPNRVRTYEEIPMGDLETNKFGELDRPKKFWALPVWNYKAERIQILQITQKTIREFILSQASNPKWGNPLAYDFVVNRIEENDRVDYVVSNDPKEDIEQKIVDRFISTPINIEALFTGDDPFSTKVKEDEVDNNKVSQALSK